MRSRARWLRCLLPFAFAALACGDEAVPSRDTPLAGAGGEASTGGGAGEDGSALDDDAYFSGPTGATSRVAPPSVVARGFTCDGACAPQLWGVGRTSTGSLAFAGALTGPGRVLDELVADGGADGLGFLALLQPASLASLETAGFSGRALVPGGRIAASADGVAVVAQLREPLVFDGQTFDPAPYPDGAQIVLAFDASLGLRFGRVFPLQAVTAFAGSDAGALALALYAPGELDLGCGPMDGALGTSVVVTLSPDGTCLRQRRLGEPASFDGPTPGPTEIDQLAFGLGTTVAMTGRFVDRLVIDDHTLEHEGAAAFVADFFETGEVRWTRKVAFGSSSSRLTIARDAFGAFALTTLGRGPVELGHGPKGAADDPAAHGHLARFDYEGLPLWHRVLPALDGGELRPAVNAIGEVFVLGSFRGSVDFGDGPLLSRGRTDAFVSAISHEQAGASKWSVRWGGPDDERLQAAVADGDGLFVLGAPATPPPADARTPRLIAGVSRLPLP
jgi:hypothetical protein